MGRPQFSRNTRARKRNTFAARCAANMDANDHPNLHGLDPRALLMRGIATVRFGAATPDWTPPSVAELAPLFPAFEIQALIGRGGMGAVYRARQAALDRLVAVKVLPLEVSVDEEFAERFRREARALARLQHPNIVGVFDFGTTSEGHLFFVMEYVEGTDLARLIHAGGVDAAQAIGFVKQVCDALQHAHAQGVVHRDIKPANVLVDRDGHVKVSDFGLARLPAEEETRERTQPGTAMGTPDYAAPEQLRGGGDHRADIYSLGVMFYELLTGQVPRGVFEPPSKKARVDERLDAVVQRALREEPEQRYQQASELREDMRRAEMRGFGKMRALLAVAAVLVIGAVALLARRTQDSPVRAKAPAPSVTPFTNSLGMKFVPLGRGEVRICIWETRVRDFAEFIASSGFQVPWGMFTLVGGRWGNSDHTWRAPGFAQTADDPACGVDWEMARAFCEWLTRRERERGLIAGDARYRLPTDAEWSVACGLPEADADPRFTLAGRYPWGLAFPPPEGAGNFAGEETDGWKRSPEWPALRGYRDRFFTTAPVGSFAANALGIFDLGGNVWEWCEDAPGAGDMRWLRGGGWVDGARERLDAAARARFPRQTRLGSTGFRVVLAPR